MPLPPHAVHPLHPLQQHIHTNNNNNNPSLSNNNNNNNDVKDGKDSPVRGRSPTPSPPPSSGSPSLPPLALRHASHPRFRATSPPPRDGSPSAAAPASPPEHGAPAFSPPQPFSGLHPALLQPHNSAFLSLFMNSPLQGAPWLYSQLYSQPPHFQVSSACQEVCLGG